MVIKHSLNACEVFQIVILSHYYPLSAARMITIRTNNQHEVFTWLKSNL